jgi:hypothetical protein
MNLKPKCTQCKKELLYFRMILMMGPRGFRRYAVCDKCAEKVEKKNLTPGPFPKGKGSIQKAGVG